MKSRWRSWLVLAVMLQTGFAPWCWSQTAAAPDAQTAAAAAREQLAAELRDVLVSWASAWQSQLDDVYLMHYHAAFKPEGFASVDAWKASRRTRVKDPGNISISLKQFELVETHGDTALVRFWLMYKRPGYADQTHKEMQLRRQGQIWMIEREHNLAVTKLSPAPP